MRTKFWKQFNYFFVMLYLFLSFAAIGCSTSKIFKKRIFFRKTKKIQADTRYYEGKAQALVRQLYFDSKDYDIKKIVVMDLNDLEGNVPYMGKYLSKKISSVIIQGRYFAMVQNGELYNTIDRLGILTYSKMETEIVVRLGKILGVDAVIVGSIVDIGTNYDITLMSIDVKTGEVIASASEEIARTRYAVDLMEVF